ncbi:molybdate transport repressor ModE-like protein [Nocardioides albertanoniae]|uniref:Molybdate transport repressor ModE-like protein n=1 Tax=Nocardioides albertanoniae TaxID=1175486 RepID=A0A543A1L6_9ACTN|nr:LysR family transcriptional regulator [Nocardioides albertanoniae]TQL66406.1 molybdate transport repressor ModE-like protein [Nocardioides albertanoniae]
MLPDLPSLRLLADLARLGSIGAAGRAAGISQQSASERLRAMETQVGLVLVQRAHRGSALTQAGKLLVEWSADLLERADEIDNALHTLRAGRSDELHVHASMTTAEYLLPRWLVRLRQQQRVAVSLRAANSEEVVAAVRHGEADLGFVEGPVDTSGLSATRVGVDELALVAAPDDRWARRRAAISPRELATRPLTCREQGSGTRAVVESALAAAGERLADPDVEFATNSAILAAVRAGGSPAFVSGRAAQADVDLGTLVRVPVAELDLSREFRAVWVGGAHPPAGPVRDLLGIAGA